jgi:hypothetical protein
MMLFVCILIFIRHEKICGRGETLVRGVARDVGREEEAVEVEAIPRALQIKEHEAEVMKTKR